MIQQCDEITIQTQESNCNTELNHKPNVIPVTHLYIFIIAGHFQLPGRNTLPMMLGELFSHSIMAIRLQCKCWLGQLHYWVGGGGPGVDTLRVCGFPPPFPELLFCPRHSSSSVNHSFSVRLCQILDLHIFIFFQGSLGLYEEIFGVRTVTFS